jgi:osmotically-inducible protein OsmY
MRNILLILILSIFLQGCFPVVVAGVGAGVLIAQDRRTSGAYVEDGAIEAKASNRIDTKFNNTVRVSTTSYNRNVLITGQVPNNDVKDQIEHIVANVKNVRKVYNELQVTRNNSLSTDSNDALISSNVKMRLIGDNRISANHIKVTTENGIVYLMGIVNRKEAAIASTIASGSQDVKQVVTLFEYVN